MGPKPFCKETQIDPKMLFSNLKVSKFDALWDSCSESEYFTCCTRGENVRKNFQLYSQVLSLFWAIFGSILGHVRPFLLSALGGNRCEKCMGRIHRPPPPPPGGSDHLLG